MTRPSLMGPRANSRRVLIVEDERRMREMLHAAITGMGLEPTAAPSAEVGLKMSERQTFAVAVVDLNLPGMGGMELCDRLRRRDPPTQAVILTGFGDFDAARQAIRLEVVDFLTKPCGLDDLEAALNRARLRWLAGWEEAIPPVPEEATVVPVTPLPVDSSEPTSMDAVERDLIMRALDRHHGNRQAAAEELGISVRKLYYRLRQYHGMRVTD